jgi:2-C-methyl-D-erythritol 4-phosphate cytidylyltransferase
MSKQQKVGAIITAAGNSQRMGGIDKIFTLLGGKPLIARTVGVFQQCEVIDQIIIVLNQQNLERGKQLVADQGWNKVSDICPGGERRQDSVVSGLNHLKDCHWVIIHDGARPLVTEKLIRSGLAEAEDSGGAIAAVPVNDTIKMVDSDRFVIGTPPRQNLSAVQTPQVFRFEIIDTAYRQAQAEVTDDATLVEQNGHKVKLYTGSYDNIKVTTPADLALAEILWQNNQSRPDS